MAIYNVQLRANKGGWVITGPGLVPGLNCKDVDEANCLCSWMNEAYSQGKRAGSSKATKEDKELAHRYRKLAK